MQFVVEIKLYAICCRDKSSILYVSSILMIDVSVLYTLYK